MFIMTAPL